MNKYETEQEFLNNQRLLYAGKINKILTQILCTQFPDETDAFLLQIVPDQTEIAYLLLLNPVTVVAIEIPFEENARIDNIVIEQIPVDKYKKGQSSMYRRNLDIAIKLQKQNITRKE